jgi:Spy/CpxP family protein refolding chaperone
VVITKIGLNLRAWVLAALGLALTVPLAAGGQSRAATQSPATSQGRQSAAPQQPQGAVPSDPSRPGQGQRTPGSIRGEWWNDELVRKEIGLSIEKAKKIDGFFQERSRRLAPIVAEFEKQDAELERLTLERVVDEVTYSLQVGRVWDLRRRLAESRTIMLYRIYQELTPDQYKKLQALRERNRSGRGGGSR